MLIDPALIPAPLEWFFLVLAAPLLLCAAWTAPWRAVLAAPVRQHLLMGAVFCTVSLWLLTVKAADGLWLHFLGSATVTLIVGWRFAMLVGAAALMVYLPLLDLPLTAFAPALVLGVAVPGTAVRLLLSGLMKAPSRNLFVFMLGAGFGGGIVSIIATLSVTIPVFALIGQVDWIESSARNWPMVALIAFPEGFMNGMVITVFSVFHPQLVKALDEKRFIER